MRLLRPMPLVRSVAKSSKIYAYARMIPDVRGFAVTTRDCDVSRNVGPECSDGFSRNSPSRFIGARLKSRCHCSPTRGNIKQIEATVSIKAAHFVRRFRADTFGFACFRTDCSMRRGTGDECISLRSESLHKQNQRRRAANIDQYHQPLWHLHVPLWVRSRHSRCNR